MERRRVAGEFRAKVIHSGAETWGEYPSVPLAAGQKAEFSVEGSNAGTLTTTDGRQFFAVARKPKESKEADEEPDAAPRSGSIRWVIGAGVAVLLLAAGVLFVRRRTRTA